MRFTKNGFTLQVVRVLVSFKNEAENDVRYRNIIYVLFWHQLEDIDTDSLQFQQNFRRFQSENGWM